MAKTLEFSDTSAQTVKIGDTTTSFTMVLGEDSNPVDLTNVTGIIAKLGNSTGYLKSQTITPDNIPDPLSGKVIIKFDSDFMNGLPAGYYLLEVWVTYSSGTAIYPSGDLTGFTINNNIESSTGSTITTITFDDFVAAMNKAASTIDKGDKGDDGLSAYQVAVSNGYHGSQTDWLASLKGDTGTVDNTGLISAPAFQSLQTQVNNSAVGTNLIVRSDLKSGFLDRGSGGVAGGSHDFHSDNYIATNGETVFTLSSPDYVFKGNGDNTLVMYDSDKNYLGYQLINSATQTLSKPNAAYIRFSINFVDEGGTPGGASDWLSTHRYKLEKGTKATDWCPNPSEILTQSDYAKIKAAIVALGGSLS